jgi:hypothetical protein
VQDARVARRLVERVAREGGADRLSGRSGTVTDGIWHVTFPLPFVVAVQLWFPIESVTDSAGLGAAEPSTCGSAWTTSGGNSPPPAAGIPSYTVVVVTSSVGKSGSVISGNSVHIVVVRTDTGYAPNPADHGTGTVVATFC